ncbi:MAG: cell division protein FtsB [Gammaproteobacteria bacterium]|nr:cell division protein FtsB [Gammaproteobacteria bacterium]
MRILTAILVLFLVLLQYQLWFGHGSVTEVRRLDQARGAQILANEQLRERNESLEAEVRDLKQGLEAIEERARSEMGMITSGETFYLIINTPETTRKDTTAQD